MRKLVHFTILLILSIGNLSWSADLFLLESGEVSDQELLSMKLYVRDRCIGHSQEALCFCQAGIMEAQFDDENWKQMVMQARQRKAKGQEGISIMIAVDSSTAQGIPECQAL